VCGENVVMRLLAGAQSFTDFLELGMPAPLASDLEDVIRNPHGMVLVTGPTGSGKTTTLYTVLGRLNDPSRNVMTIEDPVEIRMPYLRQIQVNHEINLTFATALRSILRQDPDVVLVGEIRDNETATIALQAALTGHLVLSTLHTNDSVGAVARLRDFGLPSFVINSAVLGVLAQRLVRRLCPDCRKPGTLTPTERDQLPAALRERPVHAAVGCPKCKWTGYLGRTGIYELLVVDDEMRRLVHDGAAESAVRAHGQARGMTMLRDDGLRWVGAGDTTVEEVLRVTRATEVE
jgi:general secretion pathway protein E